MSKYHDDRTRASNPGQVSLSVERFHRLEPATQGFRGWWWLQFGGGRKFEDILDEHLRMGDSRAACVASLEPLLVAAYTDELDCIAMLCFPTHLVKEYDLKCGSRLLTVNTYRRNEQIAADLIPGPEKTNRYSNFHL